MDWTSDIRKHLIQLKAETAKMLRDKENESEIPKDWLLSEFLTYEQRLKNIYRSVVKLESWLRIKYKPPPVLPDTKRTSGTTPNDGVPLTERLDKVGLRSQFFNLLSSCYRSATLSQHSKSLIPNMRRVFAKCKRNTKLNCSGGHRSHPRTLIPSFKLSTV